MERDYTETNKQLMELTRSFQRLAARERVESFNKGPSVYKEDGCWYTACYYALGIADTPERAYEKWFAEASHYGDLVFATEMPDSHRAILEAAREVA